MQKSELIQEISQRCALPHRTVTIIINTYHHFIMDALITGESVTLIGFGKFITRHKSARMGTHPQTGAKITIPAHRAAHWQPSSIISNKLNFKGE